MLLQQTGGSEQSGELRYAGSSAGFLFVFYLKCKVSPWK